jgi:hypothetical protein
LGSRRSGGGGGGGEMIAELGSEPGDGAPSAPFTIGFGGVSKMFSYRTCKSDQGLTR